MAKSEFEPRLSDFQAILRTTYLGTLTRDLTQGERQAVFSLEAPGPEPLLSVFPIPTLAPYLFLLLCFSATSEKASGLGQEKSQGQKE